MSPVRPIAHQPSTQPRVTTAFIPRIAGKAHVTVTVNSAVVRRAPQRNLSFATPLSPLESPSPFSHSLFPEALNRSIYFVPTVSFNSLFQPFIPLHPLLIPFHYCCVSVPCVNFLRPTRCYHYPEFYNISTSRTTSGLTIGSILFRTHHSV